VKVARFFLMASAVGMVLCLTPVVDAFLDPAVDALLAPAIDAQLHDREDHGSGHGGQEADLVKVVRTATERFLDGPSGNYKQYLGCVSGTQEGAMGVHFVDTDLVFDQGQLNKDQPEALMYEMRNGKLFLLGAEYIVPAADWDAHNALPPTLLGQVFTYNTSPNRFGLDAFYALHVWAWRDNPHGTFVDWNPQVSCDGFKSSE